PPQQPPGHSRRGLNQVDHLHIFSNVNWRWVYGNFLVGDFMRAYCLACDTCLACDIHDDALWRKNIKMRSGSSAMRQTDHRYRFLISYRSEGSRRLLSDVPAKVPAKFIKTNSFWYN